MHIHFNRAAIPVINKKLTNTKISLIKTKDASKKDSSNFRLKIELLLNSKKEEKLNLVKLNTLDIGKTFNYQSLEPKKPANDNNNNIQFIRKKKHSTSQMDTIKITDMSKPQEKLETINEESKDSLVIIISQYGLQVRY